METPGLYNVGMGYIAPQKSRIKSKQTLKMKWKLLIVERGRPMQLSGWPQKVFAPRPGCLGSVGNKVLGFSAGI